MQGCKRLSLSQHALSEGQYNTTVNGQKLPRPHTFLCSKLMFLVPVMLQHTMTFLTMDSQPGVHLSQGLLKSSYLAPEYRGFLAG